jgi:ATP-binding cassette subfamily C exporter for protease/lipase
MYGDPALIVLDEPNSNLDDLGEAALVTAVNDLRQRGKTIVLITHRPSVLSAASKLLLMRDGTAQAFGPTKDVLAALQDANKKLAEAQQKAAQQAAAQQPAPGPAGAPADQPAQSSTTAEGN